MKKRIVQTRTAIDRNTPNDIQDYFEDNFEIVNRDLLGISEGLTITNQVQIASGLELTILEGAISNGNGNFWELINGNINITAPSTDDSYILYASGGILEDDPYDGKILIDTATRQTQVSTLNRLSYNSFSPVILLSTDTPPTDYIQLATFNVTGTGTAISSLVLNYSDFGNLALSSLQAFSQSGRSEAIRTNQVSGRIIDESGDTTWLKIEIDNTYQGKGIEIDVSVNPNARGIKLNNGVGIELVDSQLLLTKETDFQSVVVSSDNGTITTNNPSFIAEFINTTDNSGIGFLFNDLNTIADSGNLRYGAWFTNTGGGTYDKGIILDNYNTGIYLTNNDNKTAIHIEGSNVSDIGIEFDNVLNPIVIDNSTNGIKVNLIDNSKGLEIAGTGTGDAGIVIGTSNTGISLNNNTTGIAISDSNQTRLGIDLQNLATGINIVDADTCGINIDGSNIGIIITDSITDSISIDESTRHGIKIDNSGEHGIVIDNTNNIAIDINNCNNGITISDASVRGVQINNTPICFEANSYSALIRASILTSNPVSPTNGDIIVRDLGGGTKLSIWNGSAWQDCN